MLKLKSVLAAALALTYVAGVEWFIGWGQLLDELRRAGPWPPMFVLAGLSLSYLIRNERLRSLLHSEDGLHPGRLGLLRVLLINNTANWLLPARTGDLGLPLLLKRDLGLQLGAGAGVLLWMRVLDLQAIAGIGALALLALDDGGMRLAGAAALLGSVLLPGVLRRSAPILARKLPRLLQVLKYFDRPRAALARDVALTWTAWLIKLLLIGGALAQLSALPWPVAVVGAIGGDLSTVLPIHAPLGAGSFAGGVLLAVSPWAAPSAALLQSVVQLHTLMLGVALSVGGLSLLIPRSTPETES